MENVTIYALHRPRRDIFYVGRTNNLKRRMKEHRGRFKGRLEVIILEVVDPSEWREAEHAWIQTFRDLGLTMANRTEGGDGVETLSAEVKAAISARVRARVVSDETRQRMSKALKGKRKNWTLDGLERAAATRIQPGTKPWNAFTSDITDGEKDAIRERLRTGRTDAAIATAQNLRLPRTPRQLAERGKRISEAHQCRSPEERRASARAGGLALAAARPGAAGDNVRRWWAELSPTDRAEYLERRGAAIREGHRKKKCEQGQQNKTEAAAINASIPTAVSGGGMKGYPPK